MKGRNYGDKQRRAFWQVHAYLRTMLEGTGVQAFACENKAGALWIELELPPEALITGDVWRRESCPRCGDYNKLIQITVKEK